MDHPYERRDASPGVSARQIGVVVLQPDSHGVVAVETQSGSISCLVQRDWVACETPLTNWPLHDDGTPYHSVVGYADGSVAWVDGQMGDVPRTRLDDREHRALGWTIVAVEDGVRFINDETGHGICVTTRRAHGF
ncbi:hypothetical protein A4G26_18950 [Mycobacterium kansasii]|uniref:Uncharacterized protein n=1 Tax=Mycobacterium innocens TaxID=2341083 RepID=A0A498PUI3_9MYCO|nr:hypothetical protein A4G26_18950 [Mycobacterium kansasii]VBA35770.1 hypothetical protein LAUMK13_00885 [Mycobacterium innocens]